MSDIKLLSTKKLEINEILTALYHECILPKTMDIVQHLEQSDNIEYLNNELDNVDEALKIIMRFERAPIMMSSDYDYILMLASKGAKLSGSEIYETERLFLTIKANKKLLNALLNEKVSCHNYERIINEIDIIDYLDQIIVKSIDESGEVLDNASPTLKQIRNKLQGIDQRIKTRCQEILVKESSKLAQSSIVMRNDCYCLAVKAEYKNMVKGTIQDYSSSMQTVYIEPYGVQELMREKMELYHQEHDEIEKILKEISSYINKEVERLKLYFEKVVELDLLFAKSSLACTYSGRRPHLNLDGNLNLVNARHPLLKVKKVIPNNINFSSKYDGIIITGPNTGGKTVLLKTVGLLVLMTKYGLLIPADAESDVMLYDNVFCDIGDDQSIENNLSTFSSHMNNIVQIINEVTPKSLVLFDEIGAGTDPVEGSNLAKAILKYLIKNAVSFITTTHYSDLKAFGFEEPRIINASMEFDQNTLSPTYHLLIGVSGSSNALYIAKRLGLKKEILDDANELTLTNDTETRKLILKLEAMVNENEELKRSLNSLIQENETKQKQLDNELDNIDQKQKEIINKAILEATKIIEKAKGEGQDLILALEENLNKNLKLHEVIDLKKKLNDLDVKKKTEKKKKTTNSNEPIEVGDDVYIDSYDQYGSVQKINKNGTYHVAIGNILLDVSRDDLSKVKKTPKVSEPKLRISTSTSKANVSLVLDLRGKRYVEAEDALDKYIDDLVLVGIKQATIIHGYGTGAIRELVQSFVRRSPHIKSFRYGGETEGGFGVTVIELK